MGVGKYSAAAAQKQYLPAISLFSAATPRRIAHVQRAAARGDDIGDTNASAIGFGWVRLCQVLGCARCWVVPGIPSKGWAWLCQVLCCARENTHSTANHTNDNVTAAATTKQLATFHSTSAQRLTVNTILLLREFLATAALSLEYRYIEVCAQWFLRKKSRPWASVLVSYLAL